MSTSGLSLILFRKSRPDDAYEEIFRRNGWRVVSVPVLGFTFSNQEVLEARLSASENYTGIIVTSPRSAELLAVSVSEAARIRETWAKKNIVCIGKRTAAILEEAGLYPRVSEGAASDRVAQTVIALDRTGHWLFICGNLRREALPVLLTETGISFEELQVYETHLRSKIDLNGVDLPDWAAFFSPSGVQAVKEVWPAHWDQVKKAAIGKTTAGAIEDAGWAPDAVAEKPEPESLLSAVAGKN